MTGLLNKFLNKFKSKRCPKCSSKKLNNGYWTRGWNNLCEQACGDRGVRCFDCGHIIWNKTLEEYKSSLPHWCKAHEPKNILTQ